LKHPDTNELSNTPAEQQAAVFQFYSHLYSPDPVSQAAINEFTNSIPTTDQIPDTAHTLLTVPFTRRDLQQGSARSPRKSSPGADGLPYEIISLLFQHTATLDLAYKVYSDAIKYGIFPPSWQQTCMCLLPKKGDLSLLKNWRPISLINTDAKVFTRLMNARLMPYCCIPTTI
jgi:hypothetical protein